MKIATKIAFGYGVLIALLLGMLAYQLTVISGTARRSEDLAGVNLRAGELALQLIRNLDQIEEFTLKYYATGDPDYGNQVGATREAFSRTLEEIRLLRLSRAESRELDKLELTWRVLADAARRSSDAGSKNPPPSPEAANAEMARMDELRAQTLGFLGATREATGSQAAASTLASQQAQRISLVVAFAALLVGLAVSFWIVRSISRPLGRLTEATQAVAAGQFSHRVEAEGEDELSQLAYDFDTMTRKLNELDALKKDFISHVSHELKSPLASIQETLQLLREELPGPLTPDQRRFLDVTLQSSSRLSAMIGDLLDLSRIEAGVMEYHIRPRDLGELLRTALAEFEVQFQGHRLRVEERIPEGPVSAECDGDRLLQVIGNVLNNAWKVSPVGGAIEVRLSTSAELPANIPAAWRRKGLASGDRGYAMIAIADCGPGIPDSDKGAIFEKFRQVRQAHGGTIGNAPGKATGKEPPRPANQLAGRGVGLGLSIARTIMEAHRGAIWVEDNAGGGSVFQILLAAGGGVARRAVPTTAPI
jgi:two-component system, NtrC family, sensor histidine kinase GlrK